MVQSSRKVYFRDSADHTSRGYARPGIFQMTAKDAASTPIQIEIDNLPVIISLEFKQIELILKSLLNVCLLYTSPSPRDGLLSRMPSSA